MRTPGEIKIRASLFVDGILEEEEDPKNPSAAGLEVARTLYRQSSDLVRRRSGSLESDMAKAIMADLERRFGEAVK